MYILLQEESVDNFNLWGVRRRSPTNSSAPAVEAPVPQPPTQETQDLPSPASPPSPPPDPADWWADEDGSVSPVDDVTTHSGLSKQGLREPLSPSSGGLRSHGAPSSPHDPADASLHPPDKLELVSPTAPPPDMRPVSRSSMSEYVHFFCFTEKNGCVHFFLMLLLW